MKYVFRRQDSYMYSIEGVEYMSKMVTDMVKNIAELKKDSPLMKFTYDIISELRISNGFYQTILPAKYYREYTLI